MMEKPLFRVKEKLANFEPPNYEIIRLILILTTTVCVFLLVLCAFVSIWVSRKLNINALSLCYVALAYTHTDAHTQL